MVFLIQKSTGDVEEFDIKKLKRSLVRPGASVDVADKIIADVLKNIDQFKTTNDIYTYALEQLKQENPPVAVRYNLKKALLELGPTGYPFEQYVARLLQEQGYQTKTNQIVIGWCVDHEIDVIAKKEKENFFVECKFHNQQNYRTDVQVALYTEARFHDIKKTWKSDKQDYSLTHPWVVTNTTFSNEAIKYGNCMKISLIAWNYPKTGNLASLIDELNLHPITALTSLKRDQKRFFIENDLVLCRNVGERKDLVQKLGLESEQFKKLMKECEVWSNASKGYAG